MLKEVAYSPNTVYAFQEPELINGLNMWYDGVIMNGIDEGGTSIMVDDYVVFSPEQIEIINKWDIKLKKKTLTEKICYQQITQFL